MGKEKFSLKQEKTQKTKANIKARLSMPRPHKTTDKKIPIRMQDQKTHGRQNQEKFRAFFSPRDFSQQDIDPVDNWENQKKNDFKFRMKF